MAANLPIGSGVPARGCKPPHRPQSYGTPRTPVICLLSEHVELSAQRSFGGPTTKHESFGHSCSTWGEMSPRCPSVLCASVFLTT